MKKILITTGGTGGHIIPAQIIREHLKNDYQIYFSTDKRGLKYLSSDIDETIIIDTPRFNFSLSFPYKIIKIIYLIFKSLLFLKKKRVKKVISIGGYMSLPVIISAIILRLPIFLFEPNLVLGKGNKLFLKFANKIFCYSDELSNFPEKHLSKIELIKPLVPKTFYQIQKRKVINDKFCFLIFGGSQGAQIFDVLFKEIMLEISNFFSIKVIQQTSKDNIKNLKEFYDFNKIESTIFDFDQNLINLINISDMCIVRAGATSLAEVSFLEKPFLTIPLPTSKDNHQMKNAEFYEKKGCCWIFDQKRINKVELSNFIIDLLKDKTDFINKKKNLQELNNLNLWEHINQKLKTVIHEN